MKSPCCIALLTLALASSITAQEAKPAKVLIALGSYRDRPKHPNVFFYEHDGVAKGKIAGTVGTVRGMASADGKPTLSHDGRFCAFVFEVENKIGFISLWDIKEAKLVDVPGMKDSPNAQLAPSFSGDGNLIAFAGLNRPGGGAGYHVFLLDRTSKKLLDLPELNSPESDDRMPAISGDGRFIAFASNRKGGTGLTDIYLYDRKLPKLVELPGLNSKTMDTEPTLSADANLLLFSSDRPGGKGGRDIYLYDRVAARLVDLPDLNAVGAEYSPAISPDGRFIVFVSERVGGEGERDVYLYDRHSRKLLPTPGLNSKTEDFDPAVIVLP